MDEVLVDSIFAEFEAETVGTFRPAPLDEVRALAGRRRRVRRILVAGLLAALAVIPAGGFAVAGRRGHEPTPVLPVPTVTSTPSMAFEPVRRRAVLPGVDLPLRNVWFVQDARHAWAMFSRCLGDYPCQYALGSTSDAGITWHSVQLPDLSDNRGAVFSPLDAQTLSIQSGNRFWVTTDGGATFTAHPLSPPPLAAQLAATDPLPGSRFTLLCAGASSFEDNVLGSGCGRRQLVKIGEGTVQPQPAVPGDPQQVLQGSDGRLWLTSYDLMPDQGAMRTRLALSVDDARTWKDLGSVPGHAVATVSPDGREAWLVADHPSKVWRVSGSTMTAGSGLPDNIDGFRVAALGDGVLAVSPTEFGSPAGAGFWHDGTFTTVSGLDGIDARALPDGSVTFSEKDGGCVIGVGSGLGRSWVQIS